MLILLLAQPAWARSISSSGARKSIDTPAPGKAVKLYELVRLGDALVATGQVERAIAFYNDFRFNFANEVVYWRRFAQLYERIGDLERALGCLDHLPRLEGTELGDAVRQAELLWRLRRPEAALARLVGSKEQATVNDSAYWRLLHELAWNQEQDLLALEALRSLWKSERDASVALDLFNLVTRTGNYDEASAVVLEALNTRADPDLLLRGVRFALEGRRYAAARQMVERAERRFGTGRTRHPDFFHARALVAVAAGHAGEADRDFARAATLDPEGTACRSWMEASVSFASRTMARRALNRCREQEERRPSSWDVLADVYRVLSRPIDAARTRAMARVRGSWAEPGEYEVDTPAAEMDLVEALDRGDRPGIARLFEQGPTSFSLPVRVAALEALDRHDEAWVLLEDGGFTREDRLPQTLEEARLVRRAHWLKEDRLSGAWLSGLGTRIGELSTYGWSARGEQRVRHYYVGLQISQTRLDSPHPEQLWGGRNELGIYVQGRRHWANHETRAMAGFLYVPPRGYTPQGEISHTASLLGERLQVDLEGFFAQLPTYTGALRANAVMDGLSAAAHGRLASELELRAAVQGTRLGAGDRTLIGYGLTVVAECARRFLLPFATLRPRAYVERTMRHNQPYLPDQLLTSLARGAELDDFWLRGYTSAGVGVGFGNALGQAVDGMGPYVSLRYSLQATGSWALEAGRAGLGAEGTLSAVFMRHQELGVNGYFYSGFAGNFGEQNLGGSLSYVLRWF
jgi:predicted Zn-dependent protease